VPGHGRAAAHGDADVRLDERGRVVDAVARHRDHVALWARRGARRAARGGGVRARPACKLQLACKACVQAPARTAWSCARASKDKSQHPGSTPAKHTHTQAHKHAQARASTRKHAQAHMHTQARAAHTHTHAPGRVAAPPAAACAAALRAQTPPRCARQRPAAPAAARQTRCLRVCACEGGDAGWLVARLRVECVGRTTRGPRWPGMCTHTHTHTRTHTHIHSPARL
jgi:hypothetical protein